MNSQQHDRKDCAPACLQAICWYYGLRHTLKSLRTLCVTTNEGVSLYGISRAAEQLGFRASGVRLNYEQLVSGSPLPCIVHWEQRHFVVVIKSGKRRVTVFDPAFGEIRYAIRKHTVKSFSWLPVWPILNSPMQSSRNDGSGKAYRPNCLT